MPGHRPASPPVSRLQSAACVDAEPMGDNESGINHKCQ